MVETEFKEGQRVKTKAGKVFKARYGEIKMVIKTPVFCMGSGKLSKPGEESYLVNYGGESSYVYSSDWVIKVKQRTSAK